MMRMAALHECLEIGRKVDGQCGGTSGNHCTKCAKCDIVKTVFVPMVRKSRLVFRTELVWDNSVDDDE